MAQSLRTEKGFIVIKTTWEEVVIIGGLGICDDCCKAGEEGYIIGVLAGRWYCTSCYEGWHEGATNHEEDRKYEKQMHQRFVNLFSRVGVSIATN